MIAKKNEFFGGIAMMAGFLVVLLIFFMPLYKGQNGLNYLDNLFNSISKGSAYYIPKIKNDVAKSQTGKNVTLDLSYDSEEQARESKLLFVEGGATVSTEGVKLKVSGDFGKILGNCLEDADILFNNQGDKLQEKYGTEGKKTLFNWWTSLKSMQKNLNKQEMFAEGKIVYTVMTRAVECAYNYYKVVPESMSSRLGMVVFSLVFYVVYTLWYGYAILYIFEGWGLQISH
ncbi:MAG: hypothetical protein KJ737_15495 [Proteobacteria bacterium]|nr:hypothetical protein [Pseudomonadota bacterium]